MPNAWWARSNTNEIKPIPWLSPKVIKRLEEIIESNFRVLEHGCGGSTLWFAERAGSVIATDANKTWRDKINARLDQVHGRVFASLGELKPSQDMEKFDLLLIDGEPVEDRRQWIRNAPKMVKAGGWVVLDNANRPEYADDRQWLQGECESFETFDGNEGNTLYLVTEFYKMKGAKHASRSKPKSSKSGRAEIKPSVPDVRNPSPQPGGLPLPTP